MAGMSIGASKMHVMHCGLTFKASLKMFLTTVHMDAASTAFCLIFAFMSMTTALWILYGSLM